MPLSLYLPFVLATAALFITPGPAMTVIVSNGAAFGVRAGMTTVAGNVFGFALMLLVLLFGLSQVVEAARDWFWVVRYAGAAFLVWFGLTRILASRSDRLREIPPRANLFWTGLAVAIANPAVIVFLIGFFVPYIDPERDAAIQFAILGATFLAVCCAIETGLAALAAQARERLMRGGIRQLDRIAGSILIATGLWLAAAPLLTDTKG